MKKLINEARRLQQLAGLIKESQLSEDDIPAGGTTYYLKGTGDLTLVIS
jgi:hypothetical protein